MKQDDELIAMGSRVRLAAEPPGEQRAWPRLHVVPADQQTKLDSRVDSLERKTAEWFTWEEIIETVNKKDRFPRVMFVRDAADEIGAEYRAYSKTHRGMAHMLLECIAGALDEILKEPTARPTLPRDLRQVRLDGLLYTLYYRTTTDLVLVVGFFDTPDNLIYIQPD